MKTKIHPASAVGAVTAVWLLAILAGLDALYQYQGKPGPAGEAPEDWPADSRIYREPRRFTVVLVAHPGCSCTLSSLEQLSRILASCGSRLSARVIIPGDPVAGASRWGTRVIDTAEKIPGAAIFLDPLGEETSRFGAATSGYCVLYDPQGHKRFAGGITASRAHAGDNPAADSIIAHVLGRLSRPGNAPVFGCKLMDLVASSPRRDR